MSEQENMSNQIQSDNDRPYVRRTRWRASWDAIQYLSQLDKKQLKIRESDRVTSIALMLATFGAILCLLLHRMSGVGLQLMVLCDVLLGISLVIYFCNRLGILSSLTPRQAVLTWQLIKASGYVGAFIIINLAILVSVILTHAPLGFFAGTGQ